MEREKVVLTSNEFLSLYTGVLIGGDFKIVQNAIGKVFGYSKELTSENCVRQFENYINYYYPNLANIVKVLGVFKKREDDDRDIMEQIEDYCEEFELMYGSKDVVVDRIHFKPQNNNYGG